MTDNEWLTPAEQAWFLRGSMNEATGFIIPNDAPLRRSLKPGTVFYFYWPKKDCSGEYEKDSLTGQPFTADYWAHGAPSNGGDFWVSSKDTPYGHLKCKVLWEPPAAVEKPANPKQAYGNKKLATWAVPPALTLGAAKAFGEGAVKYGAFNWRNTHVEAMTYVGAMLRHLYAYVDGEDVDPESATGKTHLEGIAACVGILLDCTYGGFLIDNRPPKGPAPALVLTPKDKK